jgi:hypothetical protein
MLLVLMSNAMSQSVKMSGGVGRWAVAGTFPVHTEIEYKMDKITNPFWNP